MNKYSTNSSARNNLWYGKIIPCLKFEAEK